MSEIGILKCAKPQCQLCEHWCDGRPASRPIKGMDFKPKTDKNARSKKKRSSNQD